MWRSRQGHSRKGRNGGSPAIGEVGLLVGRAVFVLALAPAEGQEVFELLFAPERKDPQENRVKARTSALWLSKTQRSPQNPSVS